MVTELRQSRDPYVQPSPTERRGDNRYASASAITGLLLDRAARRPRCEVAAAACASRAVSIVGVRRSLFVAMEAVAGGTPHQ